MGDSGEGLVDHEARIQERMEELKQNRENAKKPPVKDPQLIRQLESLQLARKELGRQFEASTHEGRRSQLAAAIADIDRRIEQLQTAGKRL
jgi:hypothetical protein